MEIVDRLRICGVDLVTAGPPSQSQSCMYKYRGSTAGEPKFRVKHCPESGILYVGNIIRSCLESANHDSIAIDGDAVDRGPPWLQRTAWFLLCPHTSVILSQSEDTLSTSFCASWRRSQKQNILCLQYVHSICRSLDHQEEVSCLGRYCSGSGVKFSIEE